MSALAMILAAGMTVGSGPEQVSGETEQRLDVRGKWEGYHFLLFGESSERVQLQGEELKVALPDGLYATHEIEFTDKGRGSVHIILAVGGVVTCRFRGVYRYEGDRLIICYGKPGIPENPSIWADIGQHFLVFRRVKPRK